VLGRLRIMLRSRGIPRVGSASYQRHIEEELEHYLAKFSREGEEGERSRERLFEPAPRVWEAMLENAAARVRERTGRDILEHVVSRIAARPGMRMLSLGSGPGGVELVIAREAPASSITCVDLNADLLAMGRASAAAEGLNMKFETADLNTIELPEASYDLVLCHASLHHVLALEHVLDQIRRALRTGGELIAVDIISPSGYRMRPATKRRAAEMWKTLPPKFRVNHTAYPRPRVDERIWQADTRASGMECIRSGDLLPLLRERFEERVFVPYFAFARRFLDPMYGPNYDLTQPLDRSLADWIWQLDCHAIDSGQLEPETFFGVYAPW
jgi:SAM-dependent methyltransferase